jgi:integrase
VPKLAKRLSDVKVRNAKAKEKPYKISASRGLHLLVKIDGSKHWQFRYRYNGKENTIALGRYPEVSLLDAESKATEAHTMLDKGINPSDVKKAQKATYNLKNANSFEVISREWVEAFFKNKSVSHKLKTFRRLEVYIFPFIGNKPISEITAPEVLEVIKRPQNQNKLETAHRTLQVTGQVFRYAVQTGRALRDVTADLKGSLPAANTKHMAAFTEPDDVAELLRAIDGFVGTLTVECALKLAPLVFTRPSELRRAKWEDIDIDAGEWRFLVTKTNTKHIVPLSTQAISILKVIHSLSGHAEFVFQNGHDPKKPMSDAAINASLRRMGYDTKTQITGHGFRAMARTILHERLNIDPHIIEHQLAHSVPDSLGMAYNRTKFLAQRKLMMQQWADYLDELKKKTKVITIKQT